MSCPPPRFAWAVMRASPVLSGSPPIMRASIGIASVGAVPNVPDAFGLSARLFVPISVPFLRYQLTVTVVAAVPTLTHVGGPGRRGLQAASRLSPAPGEGAGGYLDRAWRWSLEIDQVTTRDYRRPG
jgi:hypothetical protein